MNSKGQSIIEYTTIIGLVVIALSAMQVYIKRGIQAGIKIAADELTADIGGQQAAEETDPDKGRKTTSKIDTQTQSTQRIRLFQGGSQQIDIDKTSSSYGESTYESVEE